MAVGLFRKFVSISSVGAVDFRSDKERIARYTKQTRDATRALVDLQAQAPDSAAERRELERRDADRERAQQREDRVIREQERTSPVARQERERREREGTGPRRTANSQGHGKRPSPAAAPWRERLDGVLVALNGLLIVGFIVMEIVGVRLGWWWVTILVLAGASAWLSPEGKRPASTG